MCYLETMRGMAALRERFVLETGRWLPPAPTADDMFEAMDMPTFYAYSDDGDAAFPAWQEVLDAWFGALITGLDAASRDGEAQTASFAATAMTAPLHLPLPLPLPIATR